MKHFVWLILVLSMLSACATPATAIPLQPSPATATPTPTPIVPTPTPTEIPMPTPTATPQPLVTNADEAIAFAQNQLPQLKNIKPTPKSMIGASTNIIVKDTPHGWHLIFWKGEGDCPAGCINNYYWYVSVDKFGLAKMEGEHAREYNASSNAFQTRGQPMWDMPAGNK